MTTALERWKDQIELCRQDRSEHDAQHWKKAAGWYQTWVRENDYVENGLPYLQPLLGRGAQVLEIGAGTGAFTIPLAQKADRLIAVEPSSGMREILNEKRKRGGHKNSQVLPQKIEDCLSLIREAAPFQLIFASFSLYNVKQIDVLLETLLPLTNYLAILLGSGSVSPWKQSLYQRFRGESRVIPPQLDFLYPVLLDMGLYADVDIIPTSQNYVFSDWDGLISWWRNKLQVEGHQREELREALLPLITKRNGHVGIFQERLMALVCLDRDKQTKFKKRSFSHP